MSEPGTQPHTAPRFFTDYQDRQAFGTDTPRRGDACRVSYRFLETDDEYFDRSASHHLQAFRMIYGVYLPREVLEKVYYNNAMKLLRGVDSRLIVAEIAKRPASPISVRRSE